GDGVRQRPVRPAHQVAFRALGPLQELAHERDLPRLAGMRRAGQRQVLPRQPEPLHDPVLDQRQRLERLGGRAPERRVIRIACARHEAPTAVHYRERLITAGRMADPPPLTRPFRTDQVLRAVDAVDSGSVTRAEWAVVRQVRSELTRQERGPAARVDVDAGIAASSHARRDPLRAAGVGHASFSGGPALTLYLGPVVVVSHPYFDARLKYDPDWYG